MHECAKKNVRALMCFSTLPSPPPSLLKPPPARNAAWSSHWYCFCLVRLLATLSKCVARTLSVDVCFGTKRSVVHHQSLGERRPCSSVGEHFCGDPARNWPTRSVAERYLALIDVLFASASCLLVAFECCVSLNRLPLTSSFGYLQPRTSVNEGALSRTSPCLRGRPPQ